MDTKPRIKSFEIIGLHGDRDIRIDFDSETRILVAENGTGKTTILAMVVDTLKGRWSRLTKFRFDSIRIGFDDGYIGAIDFKSLQRARHGHSGIVSVLASELGREAMNDLVNSVMNSSADEGSTSSRLRSAARSLHIPPRALQREIRRQLLGLEDADLFLTDPSRKPPKVIAQVSSRLPDSVLYFPTYRRVEEDLHSLGYVRREIDSDEQLIHFGMSDVRERIQRITGQIKDSAVEWYSKVSGRMLSQLLDGPGDPEEDALQDSERIRILLARVSDHVSENDRERIVQLVADRRIREPRYSFLAYFLANLMPVWNQQSLLDDRIKSFVAICNRYLVDKEFKYNESLVSLEIVHKRTGRQIGLENLSSGEKQIVSLFSGLTLEPTPGSAIVIDEPELSLSIKWQRQLLPDILSCSHCSLLLAATHSPFVFDNELDENAMPLSLSFREQEAD